MRAQSAARNDGVRRRKVGRKCHRRGAMGLFGRHQRRSLKMSNATKRGIELSDFPKERFKVKVRAGSNSGVPENQGLEVRLCKRPRFSDALAIRAAMTARQSL
jgi:hypothetical protein